MIFAEMQGEKRCNAGAFMLYYYVLMISAVVGGGVLDAPSKKLYFLAQGRPEASPADCAELSQCLLNTQGKEHALWKR